MHFFIPLFCPFSFFFFFNDTATTEIYTLSLHDALPILVSFAKNAGLGFAIPYLHNGQVHDYVPDFLVRVQVRSEEHTSELQSRLHLVCRLLLEKKKKQHEAYPLATSRSTTTAVWTTSCR